MTHRVPSVNPALYDARFHAVFNARKITMIAPASGTSPAIIDVLRHLPVLHLDIPPNIITEDIAYHASSDETRFQQLTDALFDPSDSIIWTLRGGYGSARLLDQLEKLPIPQHTKVFIGYSDNTALHLFLSQQWHWKTIHGSGLTQLVMPGHDPDNYIRIAEIVGKTTRTHYFTHLIPLNPAAKKSSMIQGRITGGNLTLVESSIGTPWQIDAAGHIVFLEEIGEKGYRIDRSLHHLTQAGILTHVQGIVFGDCLCPKDTPNITTALQRFAQNTDIPVYKTNQFGHGSINYPIIYNSMVTIDRTDDSGSYRLVMPLD